MKLDFDTFKALLEGAENKKFYGDDALEGLNIMSKYLKGTILHSAEHDIIYASSIDELIDAEITPEDVIELGELNWFIESEDHLAHFI